MTLTNLGLPRGTDSQVARLVDSYRPYLAAIAEAERGQRGASPSDCVQETIAKGWKEFDSFRGTTEKELKGWLRRILLNSIAATARSASGRIAREQLVAYPSGVADARQLSPSGIVASEEQRAGLEAAMSRLPDDYRKVILLRHEDDLTFGQIAEIMDRSEDAARKLWARAIRELKQELQSDGRAELSL